ncbi:MAG: FAD:protein FMN transferase [Longimicrobiales bacterium]
MVRLLLALQIAAPAAQAPAVPAPPPLGTVEGDPVRAERRARAMGTTVWVAVDAPDRGTALAGTERALGEIERYERLLGTWDSATALGRLNRAPVGVAIAAPAAPSELLALLAEAATLSRNTGGAFDARVGALVELWGLRSGGRTPSPAELVRARPSWGPGAFEVSDSAASRSHRDAWIDSGGFGKGAALRAAADAVRATGARHAVLDLGGQLQVVGAGAAGADAWHVAVAHPVYRTTPVARLALVDASVATSGTSERGRHILDPRSGLPVEPWGSVTVVAPDALLADVLSTALYVMGPEAGMAWLAGRDDVGALFLSVDGSGGVTPRWNAAMDRWMTHPPVDGGGRALDSDPAGTTPSRPSDSNVTQGDS